MQRLNRRVCGEPGPVDYTCVEKDCSNLTIPASSEDHIAVQVHFAYIHRVLEFEDSLTDSDLFEGPLAHGAVVRAGEESVNILDGLQVINLIRVPEEGHLGRRLTVRLHGSHVPAGDQPIAVAREHQSCHLIAEETKCCYIVLIQELLLVLWSIQGVIWAEILHLSIRLLEVIQVVLRRFPALNIIDPLASALVLNHYPKAQKILLSMKN